MCTPLIPYVRLNLAWAFSPDPHHHCVLTTLNRSKTTPNNIWNKKLYIQASGYNPSFFIYSLTYCTIAALIVSMGPVSTAHVSLQAFPQQFSFQLGPKSSVGMLTKVAVTCVGPLPWCSIPRRLSWLPAAYLLGGLDIYTKPASALTALGMQVRPTIA